MHHSIAIIGSGYSAAVALLHLHAAGITPADMVVIGPGVVGAGQAYGCVADEFRLNVRPDLMRLWLDQPQHFEDWARDNIPDPAADTAAGAFYRRRDFARYMTAQLSLLSDDAGFTHIPDYVVSLARHNDKSNGQSAGWWVVETHTGTTLTAANVIVARGNPDPRWPIATQPATDTAGLVTTPWRGDWLGGVQADSHVAIIGAGLTAMDAIHSLGSQPHAGTITVVAPHGTLPPQQYLCMPVTGFEWPEGPLRASGFLQTMRRHLGRGSWHNVAWQERFEELRVHINKAWRDLSESDRKKLSKRVGWLWSLARFRAAPQTVATAKKLTDSGQMTLQKGRVQGLIKSPDGWVLTLDTGASVTADMVVNCTGMGRDHLLNGMMKSGLMGVDVGQKPVVQTDCRLVDSAGKTHASLFMIGPATAPALGDVIGAASISRQAQHIATALTQAPA